MTDFNTKNPFKVPDLYFDRLEEQILNNDKQMRKNVHFKIQISIMRILLEKTPAHDTIVHGKSLYCSA